MNTKTQLQQLTAGFDAGMGALKLAMDDQTIEFISQVSTDGDPMAEPPCEVPEEQPVAEMVGQVNLSALQTEQIDGDPGANLLWHTTLGELELQMTRATFDSWVRPSRAVSFDGDQLVVQVRSPYAKEWLEARLNMTIQRTVTGIVGKSVTVRYEVENK